MKRLTTLLLFPLTILLSCDTGAEPEPDRLDRLEIRFAPGSSVLANDTVRASARGLDRSGGPQPIGPVTWSSQNPGIAMIDGDGLVHGVSVGSTQIVATADGLTQASALTVAGTLHDSSIRAEQTWSLSDAPHVVQGRLQVGAPGGVGLAIEPGVEVLFRQSAALDFGMGGPGTLSTSGGGEAITMRAESDTASPGHWVGLTFRDESHGDLRNIKLSRCGETTGDGPGACLVLRNYAVNGPPAPTLFLDRITIEHAATGGVLLEEKSRFAQGSKDLTVLDGTGYAVSVPAGALPHFPYGGTLSGNAVNEIRVSGDTLEASATVREVGASWRIMGFVHVGGPESPVLTVAPGVMARFDIDAGLVIGKDHPGGLVVGAPGGALVRFQEVDQTGWAAIEFLQHATASAMTNVELRRCGERVDNRYTQGCVQMIGDFAGVGPAPVLESVTIRDASMIGMVAIGGGRIGPGSSNLTVTRTRGFPFWIDADAAGSIPPGSYTGNDDDVIRFFDPYVVSTQVWRDHGLPYVLRDGLGVEHASNPVLTLDPGVVLMVGNGAAVVVGQFIPGTLRAVGTSGAPIYLQTNHPAPIRGYWGGLVLGPFAGAGTRIDRVVVEHAGGLWGYQGEAAILLARDLGSIVRNTTIRHSGGCGILREAGSIWNTDYTAANLGNRFENNLGANQCGP